VSKKQTEERVQAVEPTQKALVHQENSTAMSGGWRALLPWVLVLGTVCVRLYYLWLTHGQPVWWDEAEYLIKARHIALGTPDTGFFTGHPLFFSIALAGVYALGFGELAIRVVMVATSAAAVYLTYRVGSRLVGGEAAFVGAWLFGVFYVPLFLSARIMTDLPHLVLCLLGLYLFLLQRPVARVLSMPVLMLAVVTRFPAALIFVVLALFVTVSEGGAALRRREYWLSGALALLVAAPFLVHFYVAYGDPLHVWKANQDLMQGGTVAQRLAILWQDLRWMAISFGWVVTPFAVGGVLIFLAQAVGLVSPAEAGEVDPRGGLLILLWIAVPLLYFGLFIRSGNDTDRYLLLALPPALLAAGFCAARLSTLASNLHSTAPAAVMLAVVALGTARFLPNADRLIRLKVTSFDGLRDAGLWIKERSDPDEIVLSRSVAQLTYYTERRNELIPDTRPAFDAIMSTRKPRYVVVSVYEPHPDWMDGVTAGSLGLRMVEEFPTAVVLEPLSR
jgi:4-amino-4-deoxy-L-arabinose transferase-like glycosyltransferase